jgi:hypothetical protein
MEPRTNQQVYSESWFKRQWRPFMAWQYFVICLFDFLVAPVFFAWFSYFTKTTMQQWQPLTLQGGGMYHLAMGAIIGITSYGKSQEKINNVTPYSPSGYQPPNQNYNQYGNNFDNGQPPQVRRTTQIKQNTNDEEL